MAVLIDPWQILNWYLCIWINWGNPGEGCFDDDSISPHPRFVYPCTCAYRCDRRWTLPSLTLQVARLEQIILFVIYLYSIDLGTCEEKFVEWMTHAWLPLLEGECLFKISSTNSLGGERRKLLIQELNNIISQHYPLLSKYMLMQFPSQPVAPRAKHISPYMIIGG